MSEKLKTSIVGCGKVTGLHAAAFRNLSNSQFSAVCSRSKEKAHEYADRYGVKAYTNVTEMVTREKIDVVSICTPHPYHRQPTLAALGAGAHVLVEKPLASSLENCDAMLEEAKTQNRQIGVISQRRWYPPVRRVKRAIEEGKIGKPVLATIQMLGWRDKDYYDSDPWRGTWSGEGGGVLVNQAPHQLDLLQWYMGEIESLFGFWSNLNHPYIEVDDTAIALLKFRSGAVGNIIVSNAQKPGIHGKVHVHGKNGASVGVQTDGGAMFIAGMSGIQEPPVNDLWTVPGEERKLQEWIREDSEFFNNLSNPTAYFHERQIEDFLRSVLEDRKSAVSGADGKVAVEIFTAIYRSTRDNKVIRWPIEPENNDDLDGRLNKQAGQ